MVLYAYVTSCLGEKKKYHCGGHSWRGRLFTQQLKKLVNALFLLGCYTCIFHGTGNSAQLCQNFGISGGGFEHHKHPPPLGTPLRAGEVAKCLSSTRPRLVGKKYSFVLHYTSGLILSKWSALRPVRFVPEERAHDIYRMRNGVGSRWSGRGRKRQIPAQPAIEAQFSGSSSL